MSEIAIRCEGLAKKYQIGERERYRAIRDIITDTMSAPFRRLRSALKGSSSPHINGQGRTFWALKDLSFEIKRGEVVGVIGRNGAGKSTLLKILSRITAPTAGTVEIRGRVGSLLEVGTGFHPELTGRENIFLNGAILGMKKAEIVRKFDEIVAFAEVEQFLDTPVKRYSSGMYVRLAFAVAAYLEPEILLVDEVLAVGDAAFQKKCLGKMEDVAKEGRTVLFVSHNMAAVQSLCSKAILIEGGNTAHQGPTADIVRSYLHSMMNAGVISLDQRQDRSGDGSAKIISIQTESAGNQKIIHSTSRLKVTLHYKSEKPLQHPKFLVGIYDYTNAGIYLLDSDAIGGLPDILPIEGSVTCITEPINLTPGRCYLNVALLKGGAMADYIQYAGVFDIETEDVYGSGKLPSRDWVLCVLKHEWMLNAN